MATACRKEHGPRWEVWRRLDSLGILGSRLGVDGDPVRGELLSYFFFDGRFASALIDLGKADARHWLDDKTHDLAPWRTISL